MQDIDVLQQQAADVIAKAEDLISLEAIRVDYLGKKGRITDLLKSLVLLPVHERPKAGQLVNQAKREIINLIEDKTLQLQEIELQAKLDVESIDVTLPGRHATFGSLHPVTQVKQIINDYFTRLGFDIAHGPEIETEFYNFEALNMQAHHPARAMHDTFYFNTGQLLRTHTSPVQIRVMQTQRPPFRLIAPGRVYRCDSDLTHTPMFHQVEGLVIDKHVNMSQLKGLLEDFFVHFFNQKLALRFRPSYFPFTEPSAEVDIECIHCRLEKSTPKGCRTCKFTGWLEVLGCGMVHPKVLTSVGIDAEEYQGFAFGLGIDRLAMLYFGIDDLRMLFENDLTFLRQF